MSKKTYITEFQLVWDSVGMASLVATIWMRIWFSSEISSEEKTCSISGISLFNWQLMFQMVRGCFCDCFGPLTRARASSIYDKPLDPEDVNKCLQRYRAYEARQEMRVSFIFVPIIKGNRLYHKDLIAVNDAGGTWTGISTGFIATPQRSKRGCILMVQLCLIIRRVPYLLRRAKDQNSLKNCSKTKDFFQELGKFDTTPMGITGKKETFSGSFDCCCCCCCCCVLLPFINVLASGK